jgi:hypothetical protein
MRQRMKTGPQVAVRSDRVSAGAVRLAHQRGLKVWVYTINDPDLANSLLDIGVDGLITNNTSLIWRTIALRAQRAPYLSNRATARGCSNSSQTNAVYMTHGISSDAVILPMPPRELEGPNLEI